MSLYAGCSHSYISQSNLHISQLAGKRTLTWKGQWIKLLRSPNIQPPALASKHNIDFDTMKLLAAAELLQKCNIRNAIETEKRLQVNGNGNMTVSYSFKK